MSKTQLNAFQTAKELREETNGSSPVGTRSLLTVDELAEEKLNVSELEDSCPCCGAILPTDTTREEIVECPSCRHMAEVER